MRVFILLIVLAVMLVTFESQANGQSRPCLVRDSMVQLLQVRYEEELTTTGLSIDGVLFEIFTSTDGTWTIVMTSPGHSSCVLTVGHLWQIHERKKRYD